MILPTVVARVDFNLCLRVCSGLVRVHVKPGYGHGDDGRGGGVADLGRSRQPHATRSVRLWAEQGSRRCRCRRRRRRRHGRRHVIRAQAVFVHFLAQYPKKGGRGEFE